jgi:hypothetical protein
MNTASGASNLVRWERSSGQIASSLYAMVRRIRSRAKQRAAEHAREHDQGDFSRDHEQSSPVSSSLAAYPGHL